MCVHSPSKPCPLPSTAALGLPSETALAPGASGPRALPGAASPSCAVSPMSDLPPAIMSCSGASRSFVFPNTASTSRLYSGASEPPPAVMFTSGGVWPWPPPSTTSIVVGLFCTVAFMGSTALIPTLTFTSCGAVCFVGAAVSSAWRVVSTGLSSVVLSGTDGDAEDVTVSAVVDGTWLLITDSISSAVVSGAWLVVTGSVSSDVVPGAWLLVSGSISSSVVRSGTGTDVVKAGASVGGGTWVSRLSSMLSSTSAVKWSTREVVVAMGVVSTAASLTPGSSEGPACCNSGAIEAFPAASVPSRPGAEAPDTGSDIEDALGSFSATSWQLPWRQASATCAAPISSLYCAVTFRSRSMACAIFTSCHCFCAIAF
mmetsp:Transcript_58269/g.161094  ORF Transcript_58269/g.161094 Transcript_58269/m.161094 type:complete len:372 (-) Transcript_58269:432-1547(-)